MNIARVIKKRIQQTIWPYGSIVRIMAGKLKGFRFLVTENSGWSPILGRWEPESHEIFSSIVRPGQTVFDLGGNNGIHALLFSKLTGKEGEVYVFEPLPENVAEIEKNCILNEVTNITIVESAVGNHNGIIKFFRGLENKQGSIVGIGRESGVEQNVQLITLKSFITDRNLKPDFIKIDIEGAEGDALEGMANLIELLRPIFYIELHTPEQDRKVGSIFQGLNYELYREVGDKRKKAFQIPYLERIRELTEIYPHKDGVWGTIVAFPAGHPLTRSAT